MYKWSLTYEVGANKVQLQNNSFSIILDVQ